jgi:cysteine-rich repeat protein
MRPLAALLIAAAASGGCFRNLAAIACDDPAARCEASTGGETSAAATAGGETSTGDPADAASTASSGSASADPDTTTSTATTDDPDESTGPAAFCGDGVVQSAPPHREECDFADPAWADACNARCRRDRFVFVAGGPLWKAGDLLGLAGADQYCRSSAGLAGLDPALALRFKALLSDSTADAVDRLFRSEGRYVLLDGTVVADDWDALITEPLQHPIDLTETGETLHTPVWTGMAHGTGRVVPGADNCADWTSNNPFEGEAYWGRSYAVDATWMFSESLNPIDCVAHHSLYCIEQE